MTAMTDAGRLAALAETGLSAGADAGMDRFARLVAEVLGVPVALVSLVESARQVFPGMVGLAEPWATSRQTPLTHSLCRHVVTGREPLVVTDAREDPCTRDSPAVPDLDVIAYAGMPLVGEEGHVLGSLCAIDTKPRQWTDGELGVLQDLAAACGAELRLRSVSRQREQARASEAAARAEADESARRYRTALDHSQLLLRAADALANTTVLAEVRRQVQNLVHSDLDPAYVGLVVVEDGEYLRRLIEENADGPIGHLNGAYRITDAWPTAHAVRENRTVHVDGIADLESHYGPAAVEAFAVLGLRCAVAVPLPGTVAPLGALVLGWDRPHTIDVVERAVLTSLAGYTARAVERAQFVENRVDAARQMQEAMLTDLPDVPGLEMAALYRPAAADDLVGGDWYDAYPLPAPEGAATPADRRALAVSIGDITGHDMKAASLMGQVRSMLRQADLDHAGTGPGRAVTAFERVNTHLRIGVSGTLVHAHLRPCPPSEAGIWELTWTNAGHPPPLLVAPDGTVHRLDRHDILVFPGMGEQRRTEHRRRLPPGSLLLLYTDGLVERPGTDMDAATDLAGRVLAAHRSRPLPRLLDELADQVAGSSPADDIALLALRIPAR